MTPDRMKEEASAWEAVAREWHTAYQYAQGAGTILARIAQAAGVPADDITYDVDENEHEPTHVYADLRVPGATVHVETSLKDFPAVTTVSAIASDYSSEEAEGEADVIALLRRLARTDSAAERDGDLYDANPDAYNGVPAAGER